MTKQLHVVLSENPSSEAANACNVLLRSLSRTPILLLFSGGSALQILANIDLHYINGNTTFSVLDERFSTDPKVNNFLQLIETTLAKEALSRGAQTISTTILKGETQKEHADRFEKSLKKWKATNPTGVIIIIQGIGEDAHTSGIMPSSNESDFNSQFNKPDAWVVAYDAGDTNQYPLRVTTTLTFLRDIVDYSIVFIVGENKRKALEKVIFHQEPLHEAPARILHQMKQVSIFTDIDTSPQE